MAPAVKPWKLTDGEAAAIAIVNILTPASFRRIIPGKVWTQHFPLLLITFYAFITKPLFVQGMYRKHPFSPFNSLLAAGWNI